MIGLRLHSGRELGDHRPAALQYLLFQLPVGRRVGHIDAAALHRYGAAAGLHRGIVAAGIDPRRQSAYRYHAPCRQIGGDLPGGTAAVLGAAPGAHHRYAQDVIEIDPVTGRI